MSRRQNAGPAADDDDGELYKRLLRRNVLDVLRLYLELSDDFIRDMQTSDLLTDSQVDTLERLPWPDNRNELMQTIVKRRWTADSFRSFCRILQRTQSTELNRLLADRLSTTDGQGDDERKEMALGGLTFRRPADPFSTTDSSLSSTSPRGGSDVITTTASLDRLLEPLTRPDRAAVRELIEERDERISRLERQKELLRSDLRRKAIELDDAKIKMKLTCSLLTEWLTGLRNVPSCAAAAADVDNSLKDALDAITFHLSAQADRISLLEADNRQLDVTRRQLEKKSAVADQENEALTEGLREARESAKKQVECLERQLAELREEFTAGRAAAESEEGRRHSVSDDDAETTTRNHAVGRKSKSTKTGGKTSHRRRQDEEKVTSTQHEEDGEEEKAAAAEKPTKANWIKAEAAAATHRRGSDPAVAVRPPAARRGSFTIVGTLAAGGSSKDKKGGGTTTVSAAAAAAGTSTGGDSRLVADARRASIPVPSSAAAQSSIGGGKSKLHLKARTHRDSK